MIKDHLRITHDYIQIIQDYFKDPASTQLNSNYWAWHYSGQACSSLFSLLLSSINVGKVLRAASCFTIVFLVSGNRNDRSKIKCFVSSVGTESILDISLDPQRGYMHAQFTSLHRRTCLSPFPMVPIKTGRACPHQWRMTWSDQRHMCAARCYLNRCISILIIIIDFIRTQVLWYRLYDIYNIFVANL